MQYDVFISYSRRDYLDENGDVIPGNIVSKIKDVLKKNGISYWFDEDGINSGDEFARLIIRSIKDSKVLLFVSTENSNNSSWTRKEIASAISYKKKIIPFKYDDTPFNDSLLLYLADLDFISYKQQGSRALNRLVTSISNYLDSIKPVEPAEIAEVETKPEPKPNPKKQEPVAKAPKGKSKTGKVLLITLLSIALIGAAVIAFKGINSKQQGGEGIAEDIVATEVKTEQKIEPAAPQKTEVKSEGKTTTSVQQEAKPVEKKELKDATISVNGVKFDMIAVKGNGKIGDFCIGKFEVTQKLWKAVMGMSVKQQRDLLDSSFKLRGEDDDMPIYFVSWDDCQKFIKKLNAMTGKKFRLPTEAEWEYAAKGGQKSKGKLYGDSDDASSYGWYEDNSGGTTHVAGTKNPNVLGLYDMVGNVSEWCQNCVVKGGSWANTADHCKVTSRNAVDSFIRTDDTGFRLVMD